MYTMFKKTVLTILIFSQWPLNSAELFDDKNEWQAATVSIIINELFENDIQSADSITFESGVISNGYGAQDNAYNEVYNNHWIISLNNPIGSNGYASIIVTFPSPIMAFGLEISNITTPLTPQPPSISIAGDWDGNGEQFTDLWTHLGDSSNGFIGVIGNQPFTEFKFSASEFQNTWSESLIVETIIYEDLDFIFKNNFESP